MNRSYVETVRAEMKRSQGIATHRDTYFLTGTKIVVKDVASFKHIDRMQGTVLELVFLN